MITIFHDLIIANVSVSFNINNTVGILWYFQYLKFGLLQIKRPLLSRESPIITRMPYCHAKAIWVQKSTQQKAECMPDSGDTAVHIPIFTLFTLKKAQINSKYIKKERALYQNARSKMVWQTRFQINASIQVSGTSAC